jgi:hypothetical protein
LDSFDPTLLFNSDVSFDEKSSYVLDELSQIRAQEENMRRCFSLRIASRIVSIVQIKGAISNENNFIVAMDKLTKRFAILFDSAYDFLDLDPTQDDFIYVLQMMNNAIIDLMMNEYFSTIAGLTDDEFLLKEKDLADFLKSILISQNKEFVSFRPDGEISYLTNSPLLSSDQVRRISLLNATVKFHALGNIFNYFQNDYNIVVRFLLNEIMEVTENQIKKIAMTNGSIPISYAMVADYYGNNIGLMCEVYKNQAKKDVLKIKRMGEIERNVLITAYEIEGMNYTHIGEEYRKASKQVTDHIEFLMDVYYSKYYEEL